MIKGLLVGIIRMASMVVLLILQIGVMDRRLPSLPFLLAGTVSSSRGASWTIDGRLLRDERYGTLEPSRSLFGLKFVKLFPAERRLGPSMADSRQGPIRAR